MINIPESVKHYPAFPQYELHNLRTFLFSTNKKSYFKINCSALFQQSFLFPPELILCRPPLPLSSCTTLLQRERERKARLLSVGHWVCSVKSHYNPRGVVSSLCGSTHKDGSILCQCLYYNINKDGWWTYSWTICQRKGSVYWFTIWFHYNVFISLFLPLRFSLSRDAGRDVRSEGRCVTIATSWLTGRIVPFYRPTGCHQQLQPVSCDHFLLLLMQREETPL